MEMVSRSSSLASDDDINDDEPLLKPEALCASLYASECTRMCLRAHKIAKISWGSIPPDPPRVRNCSTAMFSTSANSFAPQIEKFKYALTLHLRVWNALCIHVHTVYSLIPRPSNLTLDLPDKTHIQCPRLRWHLKDLHIRSFTDRHSTVIKSLIMGSLDNAP